MLIILFEPFLRFPHYPTIYRYWQLFIQIFRMGSIHTINRIPDPEHPDIIEDQRRIFFTNHWNDSPLVQLAPVPQYIPKEAWNHAVRSHGDIVIPNEKRWLTQAEPHPTDVIVYKRYIYLIARLSKRTVNGVTAAAVREAVKEAYSYDDIFVETLLQTTTIAGFRYLGTIAPSQYNFAIEGISNIVPNVGALINYNVLKNFINQGELQPYIERQSSQSSSERIIAKSRVSDRSISIQRAQLMPVDCGNKYDDIIQLTESSHNQYKRFAIKLKKLCAKYKKEEEEEQDIDAEAESDSRGRKKQRIEKINKLRREFLGRYNVAPVPKHVDKFIITDVNVENKDHLRRLYRKFCGYGNGEQFNKFFKRTPESFYITLSGVNQDEARGPGVTRTFLQSCADQLFEYNIFVQQESGRYVLDLNFDVSHFEGTEPEHTKRLKILKFIGAFLAFLMVNSIKLKYQLTRYLLTAMLFPPEEITDEELMIFYLQDNPVYALSVINMMKTPNDIDDAYLPPFNGDTDLTKDNYIRELKQHLNSRYKNEYYEALLKGFFITPKFLLKRNITFPILDSLITILEISKESIDEIIKDIREHNTVRNNAVKQTRLEWLINILQDDGRLFPTEFARENPAGPQTVQKFKIQLLMYWTGYRDYKDERPNTPYKVYFHSLNQFGVRTCWKVLELPTAPDYKPAIEGRPAEPFTQENFYKRLLQNCMETGMGII